jgi:hypothetical protein
MSVQSTRTASTRATATKGKTLPKNPTLELIAPVAQDAPAAAAAPAAPAAAPAAPAAAAPIGTLKDRAIAYMTAHPDTKHNADSLAIALGIAKDPAAGSEWRSLTGICAGHTRTLNGNTTTTKTAPATSIAYPVTAEDLAMLCDLDQSIDWTLTRIAGSMTAHFSASGLSVFMRAQMDNAKTAQDELTALRAELTALRAKTAPKTA